MDARRNQFYAALFNLENFKVSRITEDAAISAEDLLLELEENKNENIILAGDGADLFFYFIKERDESNFSSKIKVLSNGYINQTARNVAFAALDLLKNGEKTVLPKDLAVNYL